MKRRVLITNDDGLSSPTLIPVVKAIAGCDWVESVHIAVTSEEQSWISQATTRFRPIYAEERALCETAKGLASMFVISGTPADAVAIALSGLFGDIIPDLVVSGINIGSNAGLAFSLASGTIAAVRQGVMMGVPGIALSAKAPAEVFNWWRDHDLAKFSEQLSQLTEMANCGARIATSLQNAAAWEGVDCFAVDIPWLVNERTPQHITRVGRTELIKAVKQIRPGTWVHEARLKRGTTEKLPGIRGTLVEDIDIVEAHEVSISPLSYSLLPENPEMIERLRRITNSN